MRLLSLALLLAAAGVHAQPARPAADEGVRLALTTRYYDVSGRSAGDLLAAMQRLGPRQGSEAFFGLTNSELEYTYRYASVRGRCRTQNVVVTVGLTLTLPRWTIPRGTPYALERDWRRFERALRTHEDGHRRLAEDEAAALHRALATLSAPTCAALDTAARQQAESVRARYGTTHRTYDARTQHGRTQGAVWPQE